MCMHSSEHIHPGLVVIFSTQQSGSMSYGNVCDKVSSVFTAEDVSEAKLLVLVNT
jgi:hypothetical protein